MRFVHANKERIIFQIQDGILSDAFVFVYDWGMEIKRVPKKASIKRIEWADLSIMNEALRRYKGSSHDLEFILGLCEAAGEIYS